MKDFYKRLRHKIAYWLASDWIDDLEYRIGGLLCEVTGGRLSKSYYTLEAMVSAVHDYNEECARYIEIDAIKDFAERLKEKAYRPCDWWPILHVVDVKDIDELVAEMEDENGRA